MVWKKGNWRRKKARYNESEIVGHLVLLPFIIAWEFIKGIIALLSDKHETISNEYTHKELNYGERENRNDKYLEHEIKPKSVFNPNLLKKDEKYYEKGATFEQFVIDLFDPSYFSLYDCSRDNSKHFNRKVESDQNPDITLRYIPKNELFSIECKFRSSAYDNKVNWARNDQIINYLSYAARNSRPTFVVIGLGGSPDNPNRMFCLPIAEAKYPDLFISMLRKYERTPSQKFFWKRGNLR